MCDPYCGMVISGIEAYLSQRKYFFITVAHRHRDELLRQYSTMLLARGVEGLITIDTNPLDAPSLPAIAVAGHRVVKGVTNIVLDHDRAASIALTHLKELGHRQIALMKGQPFSSDSEDRWRAITHGCRQLGLSVTRKRIIELDKDDPSPLLGYELTKELLARGEQFTALFAYNDISAIGAIRAIRESGRRVPQDISVIGFDDIRDAAYHVPALTTIRQPLRRMGEIAAQTLVERIEGKKDFPEEIAVAPELVVRETTAPVAAESAPAQPSSE
jgi:LacI family transcriptional regulator